MEGTATRSDGAGSPAVTLPERTGRSVRFVAEARPDLLMRAVLEVDKLRTYPSLGEAHGHLEYLSAPRAR
jgi:hypothetical protein